MRKAAAWFWGSMADGELLVAGGQSLTPGATAKVALGSPWFIKAYRTRSVHRMHVFWTALMKMSIPILNQTFH